MAAFAFPRAVWLALLCLAWHAALPIAHASATMPQWLGVLCSAQGSAAAPPAPLAPHDGDPHALAALQCPLCTAGAHFALPPPSVRAAIGPAHDLGRAYRPPHTAQFLPVPSHPPFSSRAPPA